MNSPIHSRISSRTRQDIFSRAEFLAELERFKIRVGSNFFERFFGDFIYGVGRRL